MEDRKKLLHKFDNDHNTVAAIGLKVSRADTSKLLLDVASTCVAAAQKYNVE